jgi:hypothetical protein
MCMVLVKDWFWLPGVALMKDWLRTGVALMNELVGEVRAGVVFLNDRLWLTGTGVALMNEWI